MTSPPSTFASLGLSEPLLRALAAQGFVTPTPVQAGAIPHLLAGHDLLGIAQTGTGKTAAFALPILDRLAAVPARSQPFSPRVLILAPTRELAVQIDTAIRSFASGQRIFTAVIIGGVGRRPQEDRMRRGPDIVVGTPGRIRDLMSTQHLRLGDVRHFVLDEADRMLDLGFIPDIRRIVAALPATRQSMLFSATMPEQIRALANSFLRQPRQVDITPAVRTPLKIEQHVHFVPSSGKSALLAELLGDPAFKRVIVFTRTKRGADRVQAHLESAAVRAEALHGNKGQSARQASLDRFRTGRARVLVATDIASRGIDVEDISHVINFDLPVEPESYVHRIGRTARAGASGVAISFCDTAERGVLAAIERSTGVRLRAVGDVPREDARTALPSKPASQFRRGRPNRGRGGAPRANRSAAAA